MTQPSWNPRDQVPSELEIVTTRVFDAPIGLVFDVLTKPEHVQSVVRHRRRQGDDL